MQDITRRLYGAAAVRELDARAIASGLDAYLLMQHAARACWRALLDHDARALGSVGALLVLCGSGNNGGDGYEIARLAQAAGWRVQLVALGEPAEGTAAARARAAWLSDGGAINNVDARWPQTDWVVDALLGTGLSRAPEGAIRDAISVINALHARGTRVLAVDIPSGLDASCGATPGECVQADVTVSFIGNKLGLWTGRGAAVAGVRLFDDLGVPAALHEPLRPLARLQAATDLTVLPSRARDAYKNRHGHVLVVGGNHGMMGAALLCARAALRAGAGLVSVATRPEHVAAMTAAQPELMVHGIVDGTELAALCARASHVALGPGLGQDAWARSAWTQVLWHARAIVIDADGLNLLAQDPQHREDWILTPHPGEAARLLAAHAGDAVDVLNDRLGSVQRLQQDYGGTVVLKGAGSLIGADPVAVCGFGNPGMAVAGMGDVLTGVITALWAQTADRARAAACGVLAHARAGDVAARRGERGLLPSDVIAALPEVLNP
ncbi:NAD(P)H-hydrate dehydratase [Sinimarinibacterium sp. NLF-5-8]|uniref:NAD(P)H-hydrate dehydratase n=1 Tax=Sinimarinibacterium sp. NLF-5-8 TaxID=2698684 RepID=UPI00137BBF10|nr:NAD(P)H-hydrate dehydratase [Sinimarinibacterium sp. NLF-5-8]QHS09613.1 NAD(P)H-hydrate dehydratase [Sinimarinibacterium sp. NLF-5-8]